MGMGMQTQNLISQMGEGLVGVAWRRRKLIEAFGGEKEREKNANLGHVCSKARIRAQKWKCVRKMGGEFLFGIMFHSEFICIPEFWNGQKLGIFVALLALGFGSGEKYPLACYP